MIDDARRGVGSGKLWRTEVVLGCDGDYEQIIMDEGGGAVATVTGSIDCPRAKEDARLLASAPALRDLCRQFVDAVAQEWGPFGETSGGVLATACRAERLLAYIDGGLPDTTGHYADMRNRVMPGENDNRV